jgi:putative hydrolase of the HAD superfamily
LADVPAGPVYGGAVPGPLILDLDGVLRLWDPAIIADAEANHGLPAGALADAVFRDAARLEQAVTGRLTDAQWRRAIADELATAYGDAARGAVAQWSQPAGAVHVEVLELVRQQRAHRIVAILSNATDRLDDDLRRLGLNSEVDVVFNSSALGHAKPDHRVFLDVCAGLGAAAGACTFVDDSLRNVIAAVELGLAGHHFTTVDGLRAFLSCH